MKIFRLFLLLLLTVSAYAQAPIRRQFFTTNTDPIVDVVAGSNATVQASTPAANIRRFTVNAVPTVGQTNNTVVVALTNIVIVTNTSGGNTVYSIGGLTDTNIVTAIARAQTNGLATTNFVLGSQSLLSVSTFGAVGDAIKTTAWVTNGQSQFTVAATVGASDIGKLVQVFSGDTAEDYTATITNVVPPNIVQANANLTWSLNSANCTIGTQNTPAFQAALNACGSSGQTLYVPPGVYLLYPTQFLGSFSRILTIPKTNISIVGSSSQGSVLLGNGAWKLVSGTCQRGYMFGESDDSPTNQQFSVSNIGFDGGVANGWRTNYGFPANITTGDGWDLTHGAFLSISAIPHHKVTFQNCDFRHWRGEILKTAYDAESAVGLWNISNCVADDNNAALYNSLSTHHIFNCSISNTRMGMEFYQNRSRSLSSVQSCAFTNVNTPLVINGASTNNNSGTYLIQGNLFDQCVYGAIFFSPAKNVDIRDNVFTGINSFIYVNTTGLQTPDSEISRNIVIEGNHFNGLGTAIFSTGEADGIRIANNQANDCALLYSYDSGTLTNVVLTGNSSDTYFLTVNEVAGADGHIAFDMGDNYSVNVPRPFDVSNSVRYFFYRNGAKHTVTGNVVGETNIIGAIGDGPLTITPNYATMEIFNRGAHSIFFYPSNNIEIPDRFEVSMGETLRLKYYSPKWYLDSVTQTYVDSVATNGSGPVTGNYIADTNGVGNGVTIYGDAARSNAVFIGPSVLISNATTTFQSIGQASAALNGATGQAVSNNAITVSGYINMLRNSGIYSTNTGGGGGANTYIPMFIGSGGSGFQIQTGSKNFSLLRADGTALAFFDNSGIDLYKSTAVSGNLSSTGTYYGNGAGLTNVPQLWTNSAGTLTPTTNAPVVVDKIVTSTNGFTTVTGTNAIYSLWSSGTDYERYLFEPEDTKLTIRADTAGSGDDNLSMRIMPVGGGAFYLDSAATTVGNARGYGAVDLQMARNAATQVASGSYSFASGSSNTVSGTFSSGAGVSAKAVLQAQHSHSAGAFSADGDSQYSRLVARATGASNTATNCLLAGTSGVLALPANTSWSFYIQITARSTDAGTGDEESAAYEIKGLIERDNTASNCRLVGSPIVTTIAEDDALWDVSATADTTNGALQINVQGNNETAVRWVATVHITEVGG